MQVQLDPNAQDRHRQGVLGLRQGRHRQEHDVVEPLGRLLEARQTRAADRLRSEARFDLHADQAAGADRHRRAGIRELPCRGAAPRGFRLRGLQRRDVRRGGRPAGRHRLRRLCGRPDRQAAQGASSARRHRRGDLRRARRRRLRRLRGPAAACRPRADRHRQRFRLDLRDEPHRGRDPGEVEELRGPARRRDRQPQRRDRPDRPLQRAGRPQDARALPGSRRDPPQPAEEIDAVRDGAVARARSRAGRIYAARRHAVGRHASRCRPRR